MNAKIVNKYLQQVDRSSLPDEEKKQMTSRIVALDLFIKCNKSSVKIVECYFDQINIVSGKEGLKGVFLCNLEELSKDNQITTPMASFKKKTGIKEIWFVLIERQQKSRLNDGLKFVDKQNIGSICDKIFFFNSFQSQIYELK